MSRTKAMKEKYGDGLTAQEIAKRTGLHFRTVYEIEQAAIEKLRIALSRKGVKMEDLAL